MSSRTNVGSHQRRPASAHSNSGGNYRQQSFQHKQSSQQQQHPRTQRQQQPQHHHQQQPNHHQQQRPRSSPGHRASADGAGQQQQHQRQRYFNSNQQQQRQPYNNNNKNKKPTVAVKDGGGSMEQQQQQQQHHQQPHNNAKNSSYFPQHRQELLKHKVSHDIKRDLISFHSRAHEITLDWGSTGGHHKQQQQQQQQRAAFSPAVLLEDVLALVPPSLFVQHLPHEVSQYRTYIQQFLNRSSKCGALGLIRWFEWASHIHQKFSSPQHNSQHDSQTGKQAHSSSTPGQDAAAAASVPDNEKYRFDAERAATKSATKSRLADIMKEREHMRALLAMCVRPSYAGRHEGIRSLVNHLHSIKKLEDTNNNNSMRHGTNTTGIRSIQDIKENVDATVAYGLTRLVLNMATESFLNVVFHCVALFYVLSEFPVALNADVVFSILDGELAISERMHIVMKRHEKITSRLEKGEVIPEEEKAKLLKTIDNDDNSADDDDDDDDDDNNRVGHGRGRKNFHNRARKTQSTVSESLNDPSKGERHQKTLAALFTLIALWQSSSSSSSTSTNNSSTTTTTASRFSVDHIRKMIQTLCFLYIEHKGTRLLSSSLMFKILSVAPRDALSDRVTRRWICFTFFSVPEIQYLRPEGVQLLMLFQHAHVMHTEYGLYSSSSSTVDDVDPIIKAIEEKQNSKNSISVVGGAQFSDAARVFPKLIHDLIVIDPLRPVTLEQFAVSLFRKDQVTACHPLLHTVWDLFIRIITQRCEQGESLEQHLSNFLHNVITPFRRGVTDVARQSLFNVLIRSIGRLALQSSSLAHNADGGAAADDADADDGGDVVGDDAAGGAVSSSSLIDVASRTVGLGKTITIGKPTDEVTLRRMSPDEMEDKVRSLIVQLRALDRRPAVGRIRTWLLKELKACAQIPQFSTVLPTCVNQAYQSWFRFGFFSKGCPDAYNQNKAIYLCAEAVAFRATYRRVTHRNKLRLPFDLDYCKLADDLLEKEANQRKKCRFLTAVKFSSKKQNMMNDNKSIRKARKAIYEALRSNSSSSNSDDATTTTTTTRRSILFYKQNDLVDGLLFLLFLCLSVDDPLNGYVINDLTTTIVPDLLRFIKEGSLQNVSLLFDVLMALSMRDTTPIQVAPIQLFIRKLCLHLMCRFGQFLETKGDFDLILSPLIEAFHVDESQIQREVAMEKKKKQLQRLGIDAATVTGTKPMSEMLKEADANNDDVVDDDDDDKDEDDEHHIEGTKQQKKTTNDDDATEADETEEDDDDDDDDFLDDSDDDEALKEFADNDDDEEDMDDDDDDDDDDADGWEAEGEDEAPTAEYLARLKAMLKGKGFGWTGQTNDDDDDDDDDDESDDDDAAAADGKKKKSNKKNKKSNVDQDAAASSSSKKKKTSSNDDDADVDEDDDDYDEAIHEYPPVPVNKDQTDAVHAIHIATKVTSLAKSTSALRTLHVLLAVMRETLKAQKSQEVFAAAHNSIQTLIVSMQRFVGSFVPTSAAAVAVLPDAAAPAAPNDDSDDNNTDIKKKKKKNATEKSAQQQQSPLLLGMLGDIVSYCRKEEKSLIDSNINDEEQQLQQQGGVDGGFSGKNPIELAQYVSRNLHKLKQTALQVIHYTAFLAVKNFAGEDVRLLLLEYYKSMFADRGWVTARLLSQIKQDMFHFRQGFAWCFIDAVVEKMQSVRFVRAARRVRVYTECSQFIIAFMPRLSRLPEKLLQRARNAIQSFTKLFTPQELYKIRNTLVYEFVKTLQFSVEYSRFTQIDTEWANKVVNEIINDDDMKITNATRRALTKLERALGHKDLRAQNIKQVEPLKAMRRIAHDQQQQNQQQQQQQQQRHPRQSQRSIRAQEAIVAKRLLSDRAADMGTNALLVREDGGQGERALGKAHKYEQSNNKADPKKQKKQPTEKELEEQRKKQEEWNMLSSEEKQTIRNKSQQKKQQRVAENRKQRRDRLQNRESAVAEWRDKKLQGSAYDYI